MLLINCASQGRRRTGAVDWNGSVEGRARSLVGRCRWHEFLVSFGGNGSPRDVEGNSCSTVSDIHSYLIFAQRNLIEFFFSSLPGLAHVNSTFPSTNGSLTHYLPTATQAHRMPQHLYCHNSSSSKVISQK